MAARLAVLAATCGPLGVPVLGRLDAQIARETRYTAIELADGLPPVLAVGDAMPLVLVEYRCAGNDCDLMTRARPRAATVRWRISPAGSVTITAAGVAHAHRAGRVVITATRGHEQIRLAIDVLPPIARLVWQVVPPRPMVGDTVAVVVEARDAAGRTLSRLAPAVQMGGTGYTGQVVRWAAAVGDSAPTKVWLPEVGELMLISRVGPRADTLRLQVAGTSPSRHRSGDSSPGSPNHHP